MNRVFLAAAQPAAPDGERVHFMEFQGIARTAGRRRRWADLWAEMRRAARTVAQGVGEARRYEAERKYAALAGIDEADLSEAGRQARREALHAIRDAERRAGNSEAGSRLTPPRRR